MGLEDLLKKMPSSKSWRDQDRNRCFWMMTRGPNKGKRCMRRRSWKYVYRPRQGRNAGEEVRVPVCAQHVKAWENKSGHMAYEGRW